MSKDRASAAGAPDAHDRWEALRGEAAGLESVSDPRLLARWLDDLVHTLPEVGAPPALVASLRVASTHRTDAQALRQAGFECNEAGAPDLALPLVSLAARFEPADPDVLLELAHTFNRLGRHRQAREVGRHDRELADMPALVVEHLVAAVDAGDIADIAELTLRLTHPGWSAVRQAHDALLLRADALRRNGFPLSDVDLRGWQAALTATMLLHTADADAVGMSGRYAAMWLSPGQFAGILDGLAALVRSTGRQPVAVVAGPGRDDTIVAHAVALRLGVGVTTAEPDPGVGPVIWVSWQWSPSDQRCRALTDHRTRSSTTTFAVWADWTSRAPVGPDVVGVLAQTVFAPWAARMRVLPDPADPLAFGEVRNVPPDTRAPELVAADAAAWPSDPMAPMEEAAVSAMAAALQEMAPLAGWWGGRRERFGGRHPVRSARFG